MNRKIMASVLLAGMTMAFPVYADGDRTPDEYNSNEKYMSPLDIDRPAVVNDRMTAPAVDESDVFAEAAGQMISGDASGRGKGKASSYRIAGSILGDDGETEKAQETESEPVAESPSEAVKRAAVEKAEKEAETVLVENDEDFEPDLEPKYWGHEYQARKQIKAILDAEGKGQVSVLPKEAGAADSQTIQKRKNLVGSDKTTETEGKNGKNKPRKLPTVITGDDAQYASESGDFIIEGNVRLEQGPTVMTSTKAVGNAKTGDIWLLEGGNLKEQTNNVHAHWAHYNYNSETGELLHIKGASQKGSDGKKNDYYEAPHGLIENGMLIIDQGGMVTSCPAQRHTPCLSVRAKTITIVPNDRIIARGVQVFVKGKHVYSRDVWVNDLQQSNNRLLPHVGWSKDKGVYIALDYEQPIGNPMLKNPTKAYMRQVYYTKSKYKPFYGIRHDEQDFYIRLNHGYVYASDNDDSDEGIWLHKKMDWGLFWKPHRISKKLPLTYEAYITHGLWKYTNQNWSSWHTEKVVRLRHDRFYPLGGKKLYMDLMVGRKWVDESYGNFATSQNGVTTRYGKNLNSNIYEGTLGYKFSNKWNIWTLYHNEHKTSHLFSLGQPDFAREWRTGISWNPDDRNTLTVVNRHNSDSGSSTHGNYSTVFRWSHRFCCEVLSVMYERKHYKDDNE
ncbi:MAG: hypothetical protein IJ181_01835, partial [Acidaminococcaceae bacterium]|nr:hypothetical protein [Acidaminococcaceae bacterium]